MPHHTSQGSYLVAITRWGASLDAEIGPLAKLTGTAPPDLRLVLNGPLPVFLAGRLDAEAARAMMAALVGRGHGCVASDATAIPPASALFSPRSFELDDRAFIGAAADGTKLELPYDELLGVVAATAVRDARSTVEEKKRKLSMGRVMMTGGLMVTTSVTKKRTTATVDREPLVYLYRRTGRDHMLLGENHLQYQGLGSSLGQTRHQNFRTLIEHLRRRAPAAFYDERFVMQRPPRLPANAVSGAVAADELDLAAFMLVSAHVAQQL